VVRHCTYEWFSIRAPNLATDPPIAPSIIPEFGQVVEFIASGKFKIQIFGTTETRQGSAFYGYSLTIIAIGVGWLLRGHGLIDPKDGLGYWLGIIGGSMMLVLVLYPLRKRIRALRFLGRTAHWFQVHIILGVLGPILVLYHSNFHLGSFNSQIALYCMLAVVGSGVIGRHLYARIYHGLYGGKASLKDLQVQAAASPTVARDFDKLNTACSVYIRNFIRLTTRVAQFTLFERLSSPWHVLHMPLFFMMVISALVHVLAVHMY